MRIVDLVVDNPPPTHPHAGVSTMGKEIEAARVAAELVRASVEGRLKRKRTLDFEKDKLVQDLDKLWTDAKSRFAKDGSMHGSSTNAFEYVPNFREFETTKRDIEDALPEELKEVAKLDGFNLLVKNADTFGYAVVLEYFHPVDRVVQARISNGEWE
jgi:hypothetical protein